MSQEIIFPNERLEITDVTNPLFVQDIKNANQSLITAMGAILGDATFALFNGFTYSYSTYTSGLVYIGGVFYWWNGNLAEGKYLAPDITTAYNVKCGDGNNYDVYKIYGCVSSDTPVGVCPQFIGDMNQYRYTLKQLHSDINFRVTQHLTGTGTTRPALPGWTMDLSTIAATPSYFAEINLWSYTLPENCHILRIRPNQQSWYKVGSIIGTPVVPANGDRATLYKIIPFTGISDGYELILQIDCTDSAPTSEKSRYFSILGDFTITASAITYLGNIVFSRITEEMICVPSFSHPTIRRFRKSGNESTGDAQTFGQMVNIGNINIKDAASVANGRTVSNYAQNTLYIKLQYDKAKTKWFEIGISQPYVS